MEKKLKKFTRQYVEDFLFTKKQLSAYEALAKAVEKCARAGLNIYGKEWCLIAYPSKFRITPERTKTEIEAPNLSYISICDSGADETEYIVDEQIKD